MITTYAILKVVTKIATACHKEDIDCSSYAKVTIHNMNFQHESEHNKIAMTCDKSETYV